MRLFYIFLVATACYQIPYFIGIYCEWLGSLLMFFGGMLYKAYLNYEESNYKR